MLDRPLLQAKSNIYIVPFSIRIEHGFADGESDLSNLLHGNTTFAFNHVSLKLCKGK